MSDINIIIDVECVLASDKPTLFGDEKVFLVDAETNLQTLVVDLGLFKSKSQAIKAGRKGDLPKGWSVLKGNKKTFLYIWNPTE